MILLSFADFFKVFIQEYHESLKQFGSRSGPTSCRGLMWVQTVFKGYQQIALAGKELDLWHFPWNKVVCILILPAE